jgi:D-alanyl-lipoteichoic acid acyltransferase DltB (MBOAT superfamily)
MFSTLLDYFTGLKIESSETNRVRKFWFWLSITVNLGFLGVFKYYDFFAQSFADALSSFGLHVNPFTLNIILPVGISFYTFHGLSYVIDIYNRKIKAEQDFINYGLFVSYFPLLVAGPIERATHLLPQIKVERSFNYTLAVQGLRQILWGFFKKVVLADNCAIFADAVFEGYAGASVSQLLLGMLFFAFQIYGDFSGYSDIALGTSKLFGIKLLRNFAFPYFSRDIAEFWRRWHISLSSWFRDYLYIPLGGSKGGKWMSVKNTLIIFVVSGFWHGANWTFIAWGLLNAIYFIPLLLFNKNRNNLNIIAESSILPSLKEISQLIVTFSMVCIAWVFFRAATITDAFYYFSSIFSNKGIAKIEELSPVYPILSIIFLILIEWGGRRSDIPFIQFKNLFIRRLVYFFVFMLIFLMGAYINPRSFIYFQF